MTNHDNQSVCSKHFADAYLETFVVARTTDYGDDAQPCSFCHENLGIDLDEVVDVVEQAMRRHFERANDAGVPREDGMWQVETLDSAEVVDDLAVGAMDDEILEAVLGGLETDDWVPAEWPIRTISQRLHHGWIEFRRHLQSTSRFLLRPDEPGSEWDPDPDYQPKEALQEIGKVILHSFDLITELAEGTPLFRARAYDETRPQMAHEMVSPPHDRAEQGRMNGAGISVLYAALDPETAAAEVYDGREYVQVAELRPVRTLTIADLTKVPEYSPFDPTVDTRQFENAAFLRGFVRDVARPIIRDGREHYEYTPTQYLTEYLHWQLTPPALELDGIAYPSARTPGKNVVIFVGPEECLDDDQIPPGRRRPYGTNQVLRLEPLVDLRTYGPPPSRSRGKAKIDT